MSAQQTLLGFPCPTGLAFLNSSETPMPLAPSVELSNGEMCIPQQYLQYEQTVETVSALLNDIERIDHFLLFCGEDESGLYIQVGSLGPDNYKSSFQRRIVYGRKWRVERYIPTSEVIQTAFLALKKAAEHEVRELLTVKDDQSGRYATPFSSHVDLPLMARYPELTKDNRISLSESPDTWLEGVLFDGRAIRPKDWTIRSNGLAVVDLVFDAQERYTGRTEFGNFGLTVVLESFSKTALIHSLMNALVSHSDRRIDEMFKYRGFARFSQTVSPVRIAALSIATRIPGLGGRKFQAVRMRVNRDVDRQRSPSLGAGELAIRNREAIQKEAGLGGHLPIELVAERAHSVDHHVDSYG